MPSSHGSAGPKRGRSLFWFIRVILLTFLVLAAVFNFRVLSGFQSLQASRVSASQAPLPAVPGLDSAPSTSDQIQNSAENTLFGPTDAATSDGAVEFAKNSVPDQSRSEPGAPALSPPVLVAAGQTSDTLASGGPAVAPVGEAAPPVTDRKGLPLPVKRVRRTRLADTTPAPMKLGITNVLPVRAPMTPETLPAGQISADNQALTPGGVPPRTLSSMPVDTSSLTAFVASGGNLPILMVTKTRTDVLEKTLTSLLSVRGVTREAIFVVQDGSSAPTAAVLDSFGLRYHQKTGPVPYLRGSKMDVGAQRIALHFKYALEYMFDTVTDAPGIIIVEDDFLFAPDFYDYFHFVAPVLERDPTLFLASAWNDNGFVGISNEPAALRRTSYFPGLGWLLPRALFNGELRAKWPKKHWDHWLREPKQHKDRNIVIPEMPRVFHAGINGTFMDEKTHNSYFARIAVNTDASFQWNSPAGEVALRNLEVSHYQQALRQDIKSAKILSRVEDISRFTSGVGVVFYNHAQKLVEYKKNNFRFMAGYFGIWHEPLRGTRDSVHRIHWLGDAVIYLVNVAKNKELHDLFPSPNNYVDPMVFKGFEAPFSLDWPEGMDPMEILAGHVVPPLPPVDPNSPQLALAAMKRL